MISYKTIVKLHQQPNKTGSIIQKYIFNNFSIPLTYFFVNILPIHPNIITFIGFCIYLVSLFLLLKGFFLLGFIFYWLSFIFDIVDGNVARLLHKTSYVGAYLDIIIDWIKPAFAFLTIYFLTYEPLLLFLIVINFLAAGSWRIYLNVIPVMMDNHKNSSVSTKFSIYKILFLSFISSIEVEFLIIGLYLYSFNKIWIWIALFIRTKDFVKNVFSSLLKLYKLDKKLKT